MNWTLVGDHSKLSFSEFLISSVHLRSTVSAVHDEIVQSECRIGSLSSRVSLEYQERIAAVLGSTRMLPVLAAERADVRAIYKWTIILADPVSSAEEVELS